MARREPIAQPRLAFFVEGDEEQQLKDVFRRYGVEDRVKICMAVPMFEAWLLAAHREGPEQRTRPKRDLARLAGPRATIRELTEQLPIELARRRSRSFDELVTALEAFAPVKARQAS